MAQSEGFRQLLIPIMFMIIFGVLAGSIPPEMFISATDGYAVNVPEYFRGLDVGAYAITENFTVDPATFNINMPIGARHDFEVGNRYLTAFVPSTYSFIQMGQRNYFAIFLISFSWISFRSPSGEDRGIQLSGAEMNLDYSEDESWVKYRMFLDSDPTLGFDCNIGFNTSLYDSPYEALMNEDLTVYIGLGLDDLYTSLNIWAIIGETLTFQNPDIPYPLNLIIPSFIWIMFAYGILIVITKLIPGLG